MTGKWVRELDETIPDSLSAVVQSPEDFDALYAEYVRGSRTVFAVLSRKPRGMAICAAQQCAGAR